MKLAKVFLRESFFYTVGDVLNRTAKFLLIPFYTNYFTKNEYGLLEQVLIGIAFIDISVAFSLNNTLLRLSYDYSDEERKKLFGASIVIVSIMSGLFLIIILILEFMGKNIYFNDNHYFFYIIPYTALISFTSIGLVILRIQKKAKSYSIYTLLKTILELFFIIFFVAYLRQGVDGFLQGSIFASTVIAFLVSFKILRKSVLFTRHLSYYKSYVKFGSPLIFHEIAGWFLVSYDKIIINKYYGYGDLALYGLAVQVVSIFKYLSEGILKAFQVITYDNFKRINSSYHKFVNCFLIIFCFIGIYFILFSKEIILIISNKEYLPSIKIIGYLLPTRVFMLYYYLLIIVLYYYKETVFITLVTIVASIFSWILFPILIRYWKFEGAAIATNFIYIFMSIVLSLRSRKYLNKIFHPVNYLIIGLMVTSIWLSSLSLGLFLRLIIAFVFSAIFMFFAVNGLYNLTAVKNNLKS